MFDVIAPRHGGLLALDATSDMPKEARGTYLSSAGELAGETNEGFEDHKPQKLAEPGNTLFWKHTGVAPRGAWGSWSFGLPARHEGNLEFRPLGTALTVDDDFEKFPVHILGGARASRLPDGVDAVVFATAGHGTHDKVAIVAGVSGPLIAHWRGNSPPDFSTHVHDIRGKELDPDRHAGLDTVFEVRKWAPPCSSASSAGPQQYTIAINGRASPEGMGFVHVSFGDKDALFSYMESGPLIPSFSAKHKLTNTGDADLNAGGISTNAYFVGSAMPFTAPLAFEEEIYPPVQNGEIPYEVHRQYDPDMDHPFACGPKKGMWREFVKLPIAETPPCTPTKDYGAVDANGNPARTHAEGTRVLVPRAMQAQGLYFQPRAQILAGRRTA